MTGLHVSEGAYALACDAVGVTTSSAAFARYKNAVDAASPIVVADELTRFAKQSGIGLSGTREILAVRALELYVPGVVCLPVAGFAAQQLDILANQINQEATVSSRSGQMERLELLANQIREVARGLRW